MAVIEISCVEVWLEVSNFIDDAVDQTLRGRMEAHFKVCKHCAAVVDGMRNVVSLVGDGRVFVLPTGFSERLKVTLSHKLRR